ncbi:mitochondrial import inner membrane translocase subunit Tim9 isoform X1 [Fukomys damarensis]|nr:mitochondrial import inner membrane translocase subunit Tim9 isoform X1 [Fukomys damarensis]
MTNRCRTVQVLLDIAAPTCSLPFSSEAPAVTPTACSLGDLKIYQKNMAAQISESDQIKQFREFLGTYNKLTETCFLDCVKDFTTREVKPEEITCSEHCLQKYLKMTQRISMRFQEYHIQQNEALAARAGLLGQPR